MKKEMRISEAYTEILQTAAHIANDALVKRGSKVTGKVFAPWPDGARLALHVSPLLEITDEHREIARDAIAKAIVQHGELFVGVLLGGARQGVSIFNEQFRPPAA